MTLGEKGVGTEQEPHDEDLPGRCWSSTSDPRSGYVKGFNVIHIELTVIQGYSLFH